MIAKLILVAVILSALGAGAWFVVGLVSENERLAGNNFQLDTANQAYVVAQIMLKADILKKEQAIIKRTNRILELNKRALHAKSHVKVITKTVTAPQRECLESDVPDAIISFMFGQKPDSSGPGSGETVPEPVILQ